MVIVTASNDIYARHLGVMLTSLMENNQNRSKLDIYILDSDISDFNKTRLERIVNKYNRNVSFMKVDEKTVKSLEINQPYLDRFSIAATYRILIPDLLKPDLSKALYLDCDLIIEGDIHELWDTDISNYYLAGVNEMQFMNKRLAKEVTGNLPLGGNSAYFNSGVLLLNLDKWREYEVSKQLVNFMQDYPEKLVYVEQDALNVVLDGKWLNLNPKWNYMIHHKKKPPVDPIIIHYSGNKKPWNHDRLPYRENYIKYLRRFLSNYA